MSYDHGAISFCNEQYSVFLNISEGIVMGRNEGEYDAIMVGIVL